MPVLAYGAGLTRQEFAATVGWNTGGAILGYNNDVNWYCRSSQLIRDW